MHQILCWSIEADMGMTSSGRFVLKQVIQKNEVEVNVLDKNKRAPEAMPTLLRNLPVRYPADWETETNIL